VADVRRRGTEDEPATGKGNYLAEGPTNQAPLSSTSESTNRCIGPGRDGASHCENLIKVKKAKLCSGHYTQKERHGVLVPLTNGSNKGVPCVGPGFDGQLCGLPIHSRNSGLCNSHNNQKLQGRDLRPLQKRQVQKTDTLCSGPGVNGDGCNRAIAFKKTALCRAHHLQQKAGESLRPLGPYRHSDDPRGECEYEGCGRPMYCRGLCAAHYTQRSTGRDLGPLASESWTHLSCFERNEYGEKRCRECNEWHPLDAYNVNNNRPDGLSEYCRSCRTARRAQSVYGLSAEAYAGMLLDQGGGCAICGRLKSRGTQKSLSIDHDHACCPGPNSCGDCVRGLLCDDCNLAIGYLRDSAELGKRLALYLILGGRIPPRSSEIAPAAQAFSPIDKPYDFTANATDGRGAATGPQ
jgi:hypothetical protein